MDRFDPNRPFFSPYDFTCVRWRAERMLQSDRHNEIELNYLPTGSLEYRHGGRKVDVPAGCLTIFWAAMPHQVLNFKGLEDYFVATIPLAWFLGRQLPVAMLEALLRGEVLSELPILEPQPQELALQIDSACFERWTQDFALGDAAQRKAARLEIHGRLERFASSYRVHDTLRSQGSKLNNVELSKAEQMAAFVVLEYTNPISVADISRAAGLHPSHAMSIFSKSFGMTIMEFVRQHRVAHSQSLLVGTDQPILKIALAAGFQSISQFYAVFKEYCRCSPREYRNQHRS
jgi:AraC family transcriptional regulator, melibiose operon regulatory protein